LQIAKLQVPSEVASLLGQVSSQYKQVTSGHSNLTKGRIAAAHGQFSRIRQVAPMCTPYTESQKIVAMAMSLRTLKLAISLSDSLTPKNQP